MKISRKFGFLALMMALVLVGGACRRTPPGPQIEAGGVIVWGDDQELTGWNVNTSKDNGFAGGKIVRTIWPSAYRVRPDFSVEPYGLAGPAEIVSEDPLVIEWTIRDDLNWSDGTPVTSDDFEFVWLMCNGKNDKADCASTTGLENIVRFEKVDDKTFRTHFDPPYAEYEGLFASIPPSHIAKERGGAAGPEEGWNNGFNEDPGASAGPYAFGEWVKGDHVTINKNPDYTPAPNLDSVTFRFLPESVTQPDALRNNEVQIIYPQPQLDLVQTVGQLPGVNTEIGFGPIFEHLTFNFENEFLALVEVRRSIAFGVDREAVVEALLRQIASQAESLHNRNLMVNQAGYEANGDEFQKRDVAKAKAELEKAGFAKGPDGIYAKGGKKLSLRISTTAGNAAREQQGELIQNQLKEVGIDIVIDNSPSGVLFGERLPGGDFDIINFAWVGSAFPASGAKQIYETGSDSNYAKYSDPEVDKLLGEVVQEPDADARIDLLNQIDVALWKGLPNLPLYQKPTFLAWFDTFLGIVENPTTESPLWNVEEWGRRAAVQ